MREQLPASAPAVGEEGASRKSASEAWRRLQTMHAATAVPTIVAARKTMTEARLKLAHVSQLTTRSQLFIGDQESFVSILQSSSSTSGGQHATGSRGGRR